VRLGIVILVLCITAALPVASGAREWLELSRPVEEEATARVLASDQTGVSFEVRVPGAFVSEGEGVPFRGVGLSIPGASTMQEPGFPDLPMLSYLIAVPATGGVELDVSVSGERVLSGYDVLPAAPFARMGEEPTDAARDPEIYATDGLYPSAIASVGEPAVMRDLRLVQVRVFPVRYNPVQRTLVAVDRIEVSLRFTGGDGANPKRVVRPFRSEAFEPLYRSLVLNYDSLPRAEVRRGTYLVIVRDAYIASIADLVRWKNRRGIETIVVPLSQIGTSPTADDIKAYIQNAYDTWETPPDYVLFVGDTMASGAPIPCFYVQGTTVQDATDHPYAELDGSDYLPDVLVGRMSVGSTTEAIVASLKVLSYERDCDAGNSSWYTKALAVAGNYSTTARMTSPRQTTLRVREMLFEHGYTQVDTIFYKPVISPVPITNAINAGVSFVNYRGWGNPDGWEYPTFTRTNIDALSNGKMLPVMTSIVCGTGNYDRGPMPCFGETWIRSGTPSALRGGPVMTGPTEASTRTKWNNALDVGIYQGILDEGLTHFGQALLRGKMEIFKNFPLDVSRVENVEFYFNVYNTLGDPELYLRTAAPEGFVVAHDATVALGENRLIVAVTDTEGATVPGAEVIVWKEGESYEVRSLEGGRTISMPLNATTTGTAYVTVNATNYKPYTGTVTVSQQATVVGWYAHAIDDNAVAPSSGNGDGIVNPGERIELAVTLKNYGTATASAVACSLSVRPSSGMQLVDANAAYGNIAAGGTASGDAPFVFDVPEGLAEGTELVLTLIAESGASSWTSELRLLVGAPSLSFVSAVVNDGGDGVLDPGEAATVTVALSNGGRLAASSLAGTLVGPGSGLTVTDASGSWGTIGAGGTGSNAANTFSVSAAAGVAIGHEFTMVVNLSGADGLSQFVTFPIIIGTPTSDDPLGPDAYGYFCYDDTDAGFAEKPAYSWIEIDPAYGGSGTDVGLGYEDMANVALPFTFRYYGEDFTQIGICSNGDVGMGGAPVWEHQPRNSIIPCGLGPNAMLAPFWDDLVPSYVDTLGNPFGHGDVFTKSLPDGRFVVEWSRVETAYENGGNYQTFELVLYDPAQYPTGTGDGEILFQYHTIADVDPDNRATVGIENPDQTDGVLYSFSGIRPPAAAPVASGRAIKFTTDPPDAYPSTGVPEPGAPGRVVLEHVRPNPFNPVTVVTYALPERAAVELAVFDISGRLVATLVDGVMGPGSHDVVWRGTNGRGEDVASGVYFCRISALGEEHSRKMILMK
jgi:hypothetical protein